MTDRALLEDSRMSAAVASGQKSGDPIYALFERVAREYSIAGHLLDFGAGTGELARRMLRISDIERVTCIDMVHDDAQIDSAMRWDTADLNDKTPYEDQIFGAIAAAEVIEHLENPRFVMREWFRLLKPGGWLLFSTPNNESLRSILALLFRGHYQAFGNESYPAHITAILHKDIERIVKEAGFELLGFRYTNHGMVPKLRRLSWQKLSLGFLGGKRFSDNVLAVCRRPEQQNIR